LSYSRLKSYLITTRNQKVTDALRASYQNRIPGGNLPVFCVSNLEYWEHRTRPKEEALPFLRLSGILQVRKYCLSIVAESQLCAAIEYMTDAIPALLGSVELWVQSGSGSLSAERKQAMRNTLEEIQCALDTVSSFRRRLRIQVGLTRSSRKVEAASISHQCQCAVNGAAVQCTDISYNELVVPSKRRSLS
jgi:hypothetical protein